jgi:large subunit ribosomal protein L22
MTKNNIKGDASTVYNYSPRKARLIIDQIRGKTILEALDILKHSPKSKSKKIAHVLLNAANNKGLTESDLGIYLIKSILVEEAQRLYRIQPRARGSAFRIRRRYSKVKVWIEPK